MMRTMATTCVLLTAMLLVGCGGPTVDASSETAFKESTEKMAKSLDEKKRAQFEDAVGTLMMSKVLFAGGNEDTMKKNIKDTFHGKSADEIIAAGEKAK